MQDSLWWRDGVIYQIYPRSFADSDHDGLGDLPGITGRLDYLRDLGVDALWLSPVFPSPDRDFGYDVADYVDIDPRFGTLADFDHLLQEAHARGIRVILDLVLNHTSDQHAWFRESRSSRDNPKADWYLWADPSVARAAPGGRRFPNNWQSIFGGRAWTYAPERDQYYYHMFLPGQPDVNWRNPETRAALLDVFHFWLERGVDGFRLDVFNMYFKHAGLRDNPPRPGLRPFDRQRHVHDCDQPEMVPLLQQVRRILDAYPERYAVGETLFPTREKILRYSGEDRLHAAFTFDMLWSRFDARQLLMPVLDWESLYHEHGLWPNYVLGNHDTPRVATRHGRGEDDARAKVMMALLLTLRGTPYLYYGDEIGMRDIPLERDQVMDPPGKKYWPFYKGRDGCRSPMQWDAAEFAGFSGRRPWLPVHPNSRTRNVERQLQDPDSMLSFTRGLIRLRREHPALHRGDLKVLTPQPRQALAYLREAPEEAILVALNFSAAPARLELPVSLLARFQEALLPGSSPDGRGDLRLQPYEVRLLRGNAREP